jgi:predicted ATPase
VEDFLGELAAGGRNCSLARGRCSERLAGAEAYLPMLEALEGLLRGPTGAAVARLMQTVAPTWYAQVTPPAADDAVLARLKMAASTSSQERLKRELVALLHEVSRLWPVLLFLDDVHWADASTVDLLAYLGSHLAGLRVLLVLADRPADLALSRHPLLGAKLELQGRGVCRELPLGFLGRPDVDSYLALTFPEHTFPPAFAGLIHSRTEGNPLFLVELLRYLRERGALAEAQGRWALTGSLPDLQRELPETVRSLIQRQLAQLSEADRGLLLAASVRGHEFEAAVLARALGVVAAAVEERLEVLERAHALVRFLGTQEFPDGTLTLRYGFVHVLYQHALYESLRPTRRAALSAALAQALLDQHGAEGSAVAAELALLFEAARDWPRAAHFFLLAAQNATRVFANQEAIALARRGLELLQTLPDTPERAQQELRLQLTLSLPLQATRGMGALEVQQTYLRGRTLCQQLGDSVQLFPVLYGLQLFSLVRAEFQTGRELAEQLLRLAQSVQAPPLLVEAHLALETVLVDQGEFLLALEHYRQLLALHDPQQHGSPRFLYGHDPGVFGRCFAAWALWFVGHPDQAVATIHEALTLIGEFTHPLNRAHAHLMAAMIHQFRREPRMVQEHAEAASAVANEQGLALHEMTGMIYRGWALAQQGRHAEGIAQLRQGLAACRADGLELIRPGGLALLAEVLGAASQAEEGLTLLAEAVAAAQRRGDFFYDAEIHRLQGELLLRQAGTPDGALPDSVHCAAETSFRQALAIARRQSAKSLELRAVLGLSRLYQRQGQPADAPQMLAETYGWFTEGFDTPDLQEGRALLDQLS